MTQEYTCTFVNSTPCKAFIGMTLQAIKVIMFWGFGHENVISNDSL